ncbi:MAG: hypothetical protein M1831_007607 [Alyxoria varia]|nr:MAG: hypothetical protein M1831_007607 [Alyxoria varia]
MLDRRAPKNIMSKVQLGVGVQTKSDIVRSDVATSIESRDRACDPQMDDIAPNDSASNRPFTSSSSSASDDQTYDSSSVSIGSLVVAQRALRSSTYGLLEGCDGQTLRRMGASENLRERVSSQAASWNINSWQREQQRQLRQANIKLAGADEEGRSASRPTMHKQRAPETWASTAAYGERTRRRRRMWWWNKVKRPVHDIWMWKKTKRILVA